MSFFALLVIGFAVILLVFVFLLVVVVVRSCLVFGDLGVLGSGCGGRGIPGTEQVTLPLVLGLLAGVEELHHGRGSGLE